MMQNHKFWAFSDTVNDFLNNSFLYLKLFFPLFFLLDSFSFRFNFSDVGIGFKPSSPENVKAVNSQMDFLFVCFVCLFCVFVFPCLFCLFVSLFLFLFLFFLVCFVSSFLFLFLFIFPCLFCLFVSLFLFLIFLACFFVCFCFCFLMNKW